VISLSFIFDISVVYPILFLIMRIFKVSLAFLVLSFQLDTTAAFHWARDVNFTYCLAKIKYLNTSDLSDNITQTFLFDPATDQRIKPDNVLLTLLGCEKLCHSGFELWPMQDTVPRLFLWLVPVVVLVVHFHFAPLSGLNICQVIFHLLGDPIDSMWSMLTRQEVNRRFFRRATTSALLGGQPLATILSAYDELGWQDASTHFFESLRARTPIEPPTEISTTPEEEVETSQSSNSRLPTFLKPSPEPTTQETHFEIHPDEIEIHHIQVAAQRITSNRSESQLTTWIAIGSLVGALIGAFIRTYTLRLNNQTSHTIASVSLLFIFIPLVKISGNIGAFTSSTAAVNIIQELRHNLQEHDRSLEADRPCLFPPFVFDERACWYGNTGLKDSNIQQPSTPAIESGDTERLLENIADDSEEVKNLENWPSMAAWLGMNSSWRPEKQITTKDQYVSSDRSPSTLFIYSALFVYGGSYSPALILSYFTPLVGFGCRSGAWTFIAFLWTLSCVIDIILKRTISSAKKLWTWTIMKDFVFSLLIVLTMIVVQVGLFNSCWCRSGGKQSYIDLNPLTNEEWNTGWALWVLTPMIALSWIAFWIWIIGIDGDNARTLLNRSSEMRVEDIIHLRIRKRWLLRNHRKSMTSCINDPSVEPHAGLRLGKGKEPASSPASARNVYGSSPAAGTSQSRPSTAVTSRSSIELQLLTAAQVETEPRDMTMGIGAH
jgi:hypothetical protein